jgi:hypothetical protein
MSSARYRGWLAWLSSFAVFLLTTKAAVAQYESRIVSQNPGNYWRLNETTGTNAAARVGTLNGTYMNSPGLGQPGPRPPALPGFEAGNNAPRFNQTAGTNNFFVADASILNDRAAFSMTGWFFQPASQTADRIGLFGQNDSVEFGFINPTTIQLWTPMGGSLDVPWNDALNNTWVHIAAVGNGTNLIVYLNGSQAGQGGASTTNYGTSTFPFRIGGGGIYDDGVGNTNSFNGLIDEVAVWGRALTAAEVQAQYTAGITPIPEPVSLFLGTTGMVGVAGVVWRRRKAARAVTEPCQG